MAKEIERKFLVDKDKWELQQKTKGKFIKQTYLSKDPTKTIRIRIYDTEAWIGIKGAMKGISRTEYEYQIPLNDAKEMIHEFGGKCIEKLRYVIPFQEKQWEVDVFAGDNTGLIVAEIELKSEHESFEKPDWLGKEVTKDPKYLNVLLQEKPFNSWH